MWIQDANREDLINILQSSRLPSKALKTINTIHELPDSKAELQFVWGIKPLEWKQLPSLIVTNNITIRDFFAWTGTYLSQCRPLTAFCRVIDKNNLQYLFQNSYKPIAGKIEAVCIGLIVGEVATYLMESFDVSRLHAVSYGGTYSFAKTQAIEKNMIIADNLSDRWQKARHMTSQKQLALSQSDLDQAWDIVLNIIDTNSNKTTNADEDQRLIYTATKQLFENGDIEKACWNELSKDIFSKGFSQALLKGPREERVLQVEQALSLLCDGAASSCLKITFIAGYIASRIAPGTFDHYAMLRRYVSKLPALLLWYGLIAGLTKNSTLHNLGAGIGRRIIRDAAQEEDILFSPKCDISFEELEVLHNGGKNNTLKIYPGEPKHLTIELLPCVNSLVRNVSEPQKGTSGRAIQKQLSLFDNYKVEELKKLNIELERAVHAISNIQGQISKELSIEKQNLETTKKTNKKK